jgi:hypothetical protein
LSKPKFVLGPALRLLITFVALLQIYAYVFVVLYSLMFGGIDYVIPVKISFLSTIFVVAVLTEEDVRVGLRTIKDDLGPLGVAIYRLLVELITFSTLVYLAYLFLPHTFSDINLSTLEFETKGFVLVGIGSIVAFSGTGVRDIYALRRKGEIPKVMGAT